MVKNYRSSRSKKSGVSSLKNFGGEQLTVLIFLDLIQDLDLVVPILKRAKERSNLAFKVCVTDWLIGQSPRVENNLQLLEADYFVVSQHKVRAGIEPNLNGIQALLTVSETTAGPHKSAHVLTQRANQAGLCTYTLQHGFENIGLTYFDEIHTPDSIRFASQKILIWGDLNSLSLDILPETKQRCVPVGCLKENPQISQIAFPKNREYLVAVFENLHWHRYNDNYKNQFLEHLEKTAAYFSNTTFLVKPHHAGKWLTERYQGNIPQADNFIIADPKEPKWETYTAPALINYADGVITTPSTVALDAAVVNCPVSVVGYDLDLKIYAPLPILNQWEDWINFIEQLQNPQGNINARQQTKTFVNQHILAGNPVERIFNLIATDISAKQSLLAIGEQVSYPSQAALNFLESIPFEYKFRGISNEDFLNSLITERSLFLGDVLETETKSKVISLILLVDREITNDLELTLKSWELQSCPLINCWLVPLGSQSIQSLRNWLKKQKFSFNVHIWNNNDRAWLQIKQQSDFVLFSRIGDVLALSLATRLKLIARSELADVIVWNLQQLDVNQDSKVRVENFLRRPQLELHTIRHINYIGTTVAVKPSLASVYPYNLFDQIIANDGHLFHIWLANNSELKWQTQPEYLTLRAYHNKPDSLQKLFEPFQDIYQELFTACEEDFVLEVQKNQHLPYVLKPKSKAKSISVIIPFRDKPEETCNSLASVFKQKISGSLEVILVNNQSNEDSLTKIRKYLKKRQLLNYVKQIDYYFPFNHSRQCNLGVAASTGEVLIFLNNDAQIIQESVLEEMASWALISGVATVGCKISSSDDRYLCAGIKAKASVSPKKIPKNVAFVEESRDSTYADAIRETYGNSFACSAISRKNYNLLGGLNAQEFPNGFNDVEFCLRSRQLGYRHIYLGYLKVEHLPGTTRGRCDEFIQSMLIRQRFIDAAADGIWQLEQDEVLMEALKTGKQTIKSTNKTPESNSKISNNHNEILNFKDEMVRLQSINQQLNLEIEAMKTSKFWKLREKWFSIKHLLGIKTE